MTDDRDVRSVGRTAAEVVGGAAAPAAVGPVAGTDERERVLRSVLADPRAVVIAFDEDGFPIPVPDFLLRSGHRTLALPVGATTTLDLIVAEDTMAVVRAWERAMDTGLGAATAHAREEPDRLLSLTFIDGSGLSGNSLDGVVVGVLAATGPSADDDAGPLVGSLTIPTRPRTAGQTKNRQGVITTVDDRTTTMLGWLPEQIIGLKSLELVHPDDQQRALGSWLNMLATGEARRVRLRYRCADGTWLWVETENVPHGPPSSTPHLVACQLSDISDEMAAHEAVTERGRLFRRLTEALPIGLLRIDSEGLVGYANASVANIIGMPAVSTVEAQVALVDEPDRDPFTTAVAAALHGGVDRELEVGIHRAGTGESRRCAVTLISLSDREGEPGALICLQDITDSAQVREELKVRATSDALTGCLNRASVTAALDEALTSAASAGSVCCSWTSTTSRRSTTLSVMPPGMRSWSSSPISCARRSVPATSWDASAGMSSS